MNKILFVFSIVAFLSSIGITQAQSSLILGAYNKTVAPGQEICLEVYGRQFIDILSMQYTLKWDANVLEFKGIKGFSLTGLSAENFGTHRTKEGMLTFAWFEPSLRGVTVPDGTALYQICFKVKAKAETKTQLEFTDTPTDIEIVNTREVFLSLKGEGGAIKVKN